MCNFFSCVALSDFLNGSRIGQRALEKIGDLWERGLRALDDMTVRKFLGNFEHGRVSAKGFFAFRVQWAWRQQNWSELWIDSQSECVRLRVIPKERYLLFYHVWLNLDYKTVLNWFD